MAGIRKKTIWAAVLSITLAIGAAQAQEATENTPIVLKTMGALFFGGTVSQRPDGDTFHGDHGYAQYYIPQNPRQYPMVMWHGIGQSGKTYESTPDGREGYMQIMSRRDWPVYEVRPASRPEFRHLKENNPTRERGGGVKFWRA